MYTLGAGRILIKSIISVCLLNLMAWKASWAHRTGENEKKDNDKIKKSVQTSSACDLIEHLRSTLVLNMSIFHLFGILSFMKTGYCLCPRCIYLTKEDSGETVLIAAACLVPLSQKLDHSSNSVATQYHATSL